MTSFNLTSRPESDISANSEPFDHLDERFFAPVADLRLLPDWSPPAGSEGGRFLNRHDGGSLEFKQHRSYGPGDDVRRVDWAVFGRTKKLYTRVVEAEHTPELVIAIDHSASMAAGGLASKFGAAVQYALLLAYVALNSDYRVHLVPFGPSEGSHSAQGVALVHASQIHTIGFDRLSRWPVLGETNFQGLGEQSLSWRRRGATLVVISDFLIDVPDENLRHENKLVPSWFDISQHERQVFDRARAQARERIIASLDLLYAALEPLKTPNVRTVLMPITGGGEQSLTAARSIFDLESGFLQRVLFTKASERAYRAAQDAHHVALTSLARDLGAAVVATQGTHENVHHQDSVETRRSAIEKVIFGLGFGPFAIDQHWGQAP